MRRASRGTASAAVSRSPPARSWRRRRRTCRRAAGRTHPRTRRPWSAPTAALKVSYGVSPTGIEPAAASREPAADQPRLDHDDVDPESLELEAECVAQGLDGVLRRVVPAAAREGQLAAHRADVDDPAPAFPPHGRQHELGQAREAEDVRLELPSRLVQRHALDGAAQAVARVVDERTDRTGGALDLRDRALQGLLVGDVELQQACSRPPRAPPSTRAGGPSRTPSSPSARAELPSPARCPRSSP